MKKVKWLVVMMAMGSVLMFANGCAGCNNDLKHIKSQWVGLNRHITLFNNNGGIIREWDTRAKVEDNGGTCYFIVDGKAVTIAGTFLIEEK